MNQRLLARTWWAIGPAFVVLTARLAIDRACRDPYNLVPGLASKPVLAWALAALYLGAHLWLLLAYLRTSIDARTLLPLPRDIRAVWGRGQWKVWVLVAVMTVEYSPQSFSRLAGRSGACHLIAGMSDEGRR